MPVIVAGDFNEVPENTPIKEIMEKDFIDLFIYRQMQDE